MIILKSSHHSNLEFCSPGVILALQEMQNEGETIDLSNFIDYWQVQSEIYT